MQPGEDLLIHIGYPKSGSTYLQDVIFSRPDVRLIKQPDIHALAGTAPCESDAVRAVLTGGAQDRAADAALTVLSQEKLSGNLNGANPDTLLRMADRLHAAYPDARILAVTRNQMEYTMSLYCWRVIQRGLECREIDKYLEDIFVPQLKKKLCYHLLIDHYVGLWGADGVKVLPFELVTQDGPRFMRELASFTGLPLAAAPPDKRVNTTLRSADLVNYCRRANRLLALPMKLVGPLLPNRLHRRFGQKVIGFKRRIILPTARRRTQDCHNAISLPDKWQGVYRDAFAASNRELQRLCGVDLGALGYAI
jgi:hypothetical protein